jgi:SPP1 family predicted phage head-tail adaptor
MKTKDARMFNAVIQLITANNSNDGFGGVTTNLTVTGTLYARHELVRSSNQYQTGGLFTEADSMFYIRKANFDPKITMIGFNGKNYTILDVKENDLGTQLELITKQIDGI